MSSLLVPCETLHCPSGHIEQQGASNCKVFIPDLRDISSWSPPVALLLHTIKMSSFCYSISLAVTSATSRGMSVCPPFMDYLLYTGLVVL